MHPHSSPICSVIGCERPSTTRGYCGTHYERWRRGKDLDRPIDAHPLTPLAVRFWAKVNKEGPVLRPELGPCWVWTRGTTRSGYGQITAGLLADGTRGPLLAHRLSYEMAEGPIPDGLWVLHRCDNPPCVRPAHLFLGTVLENNDDMRAKERHTFGTRFTSAKLTEEIVRSMRERYSAGGVTLRILADEYGINPKTVHKVIRRLSWSHVA